MLDQSSNLTLYSSATLGDLQIHKYCTSSYSDSDVVRRQPIDPLY